MQDFKDKVAVITGGASGIGLAYAERFGAAGAKVVLADIEKPRLDAAVAQLNAKGIETIGKVTDVSRYEEVEALAETARGHFGKVHLVFNNAGVSITGPTWKQSIDDWRWIYGVNVFGIVHGVKAFVPMLLEQNEPAHVINTASLASFNGTGEHGPYCSSKAAALSISQALFSELRGLVADVGVTVVCPGMVATDINRSWRTRPKEHKAWSNREYADENFIEQSNKFQNSGIKPDEVAELVFHAVRDRQFYVFTGDNWEGYLKAFLTPAMNAENPPVLTWGTDLRPQEERLRTDWTRQKR